ncbi:MAG TPA: pyridoxal-phosphate dependent enzyme [Pseudonocardiaceae bacterium]|nr:pyridoxal-phosphate dependent enzyme [Pseudonocardiaceae bacterium]
MSLTSADVADRAEAVTPRLRDHLPVTPLVRFDAFSEELGAEVLVKCEYQQRTGSFKARGSLAKAMTLTRTRRQRGVVTASTGNHGLGVTNALQAIGGHAVVFVPDNASTAKVAALRRQGAEIHTLDADPGVVERHARAYAGERGLVYLPPYNDPDVIAGQGTVGVELMEQLDGRPVDAVFVTVGGGGLISGVGSVVKHRLPGTRVYGASPANDAAMLASVRAGRVVEVPTSPTVSDGSAGNIEDGTVTVDLCADVVDTWVTVTEPEIGSALATVIDTEHQLVEGAAAVAFAAARARRADFTGGRIVVVACGANIAAVTLAAALAIAR